MSYVFTQGGSNTPFEARHGSISIRDGVVKIGASKVQSQLVYGGKVINGLGEIIEIPEIVLDRTNTNVMADYPDSKIMLYSSHGGFWWWDVWGYYPFINQSQFTTTDTSFSADMLIMVVSDGEAVTGRILSVGAPDANGGIIISTDLNIDIGVSTPELHKLTTFGNVAMGDKIAKIAEFWSSTAGVSEGVIPVESESPFLDRPQYLTIIGEKGGDILAGNTFPSMGNGFSSAASGVVSVGQKVVIETITMTYSGDPLDPALTIGVDVHSGGSDNSPLLSSTGVDNTTQRVDGSGRTVFDLRGNNIVIDSDQGFVIRKLSGIHKTSRTVVTCRVLDI